MLWQMLPRVAPLPQLGRPAAGTSRAPPPLLRCRLPEAALASPARPPAPQAPSPPPPLGALVFVVYKQEGLTVEGVGAYNATLRDFVWRLTGGIGAPLFIQLAQVE